MSHQPHVHLISLGGTITMAAGQDRGRGVTPQLQAEDLIAAVPDLAGQVRLTGETLKSVGSPNIAFADVIAAARRIEKVHAEGYVVVQGTDTLEETAFLLDMMLGAQARAVVTGALKPADAPGADGPANLTDAVRTAMAPGLSGRGVVVAIQGQVHGGRWVTKRHTHSLAAFDSQGHAPLGALCEGQVDFFGLSLRPPFFGVPSQAMPPVALWEAVMDEDGRLLAQVAAAGYAGLVIAGFGGGHLSQAQADIAARLAADIPVILTSRCGEGRVLRNSYGYPGAEIDLLARGLIWGGCYRPRQARLLLALALAHGHDRTSLPRLFES